MAMSFTKARLDKISPGAPIDTIGGGAVDHIAFRCEDYDGVIERIEAHGLSYHAVSFPNFPVQQIFVNDPSGVTCELNFLKQGHQPGQMGSLDLADQNA